MEFKWAHSNWSNDLLHGEWSTLFNEFDSARQANFMLTFVLYVRFHYESTHTLEPDPYSNDGEADITTDELLRVVWLLQ